jgi:hypothetical protein
MERFNFQKLNDVEVKEEYQVKISNRFAALEIMNINISISIGLGRVLERILKLQPQETVGNYDLKQHKPWFDECPKIIRSREAG